MPFDTTKTQFGLTNDVSIATGCCADVCRGLMYPTYTFSERQADGLVHIVSVSAGVIAAAGLLAAAAPRLPISSTAGLAIYGVAMILMFGFSAAYHLVPAPTWKGLLRRCDQAAIFVKIAGTYTPFTFIKMGGVWGYGLLSAVWAVALVGVAAKLFLASNWDKAFVALYLVLGWMGLVAIQPLIASVPLTALMLLGIGGGLYTVGVIFHLWEKLRYQNAIWHFFVLAGAACHFGAVVSAIFE